MKKVLMIAVAALVAVSVVASVAFLVFGNPSGSSQTNTQNSAALPSGSTNNQNKNAVVTITYDKGRLADCGTGLMVAVSIKNEGYTNFKAAASSFVFTANGVTYPYSYSDTKLLGWQNTDIPDGGSYEATMVFQGNAMPASFVLSYNSGSTDYNIVCQQK